MRVGTVCSICFERIRPEAEAFLDTCFHSFCLEVGGPHLLVFTQFTCFHKLPILSCVNSVQQTVHCYIFAQDNAFC